MKPVFVLLTLVPALAATAPADWASWYGYKDKHGHLISYVHYRSGEPQSSSLKQVMVKLDQCKREILKRGTRWLHFSVRWRRARKIAETTPPCLRKALRSVRFKLGEEYQVRIKFRYGYTIRRAIREEIRRKALAVPKTAVIKPPWWKPYRKRPSHPVTVRGKHVALLGRQVVLHRQRGMIAAIRWPKNFTPLSIDAKNRVYALGRDLRVYRGDLLAKAFELAPLETLPQAQWSAAGANLAGLTKEGTLLASFDGGATFKKIRKPSRNPIEHVVIRRDGLIVVRDRKNAGFFLRKNRRRWVKFPFPIYQRPRRQHEWITLGSDCRNTIVLRKDGHPTHGEAPSPNADWKAQFTLTSEPDPIRKPAKTPRMPGVGPSNKSRRLRKLTTKCHGMLGLSGIGRGGGGTATGIIPGSTCKVCFRGSSGRVSWKARRPHAFVANQANKPAKVLDISSGVLVDPPPGCTIKQVFSRAGLSLALCASQASKKITVYALDHLGKWHQENVLKGPYHHLTSIAMAADGTLAIQACNAKGCPGSWVRRNRPPGQADAWFAITSPSAETIRPLLGGRALVVHAPGKQNEFSLLIHDGVKAKPFVSKIVVPAGERLRSFSVEIGGDIKIFGRRGTYRIIESKLVSDRL